MALLGQKGAVIQEGRFIKIIFDNATKIYVVNSRDGKLQEIV